MDMCKLWFVLVHTFLPFSSLITHHEHGVLRKEAEPFLREVRVIGYLEEASKEVGNVAGVDGGEFMVFGPGWYVAG